MISIKEKFPHEIMRTIAELTVLQDRWYLQLVSFGPDARYKSKIRILNSVELEKLKKDSMIAWEKLKNIQSHLEENSSNVNLKISDDLTISVLGRDRGWVSFNCNVIFSTEESFRSFLAALEWCEERGPILMQKCKILDSI